MLHTTILSDETISKVNGGLAGLDEPLKIEPKMTWSPSGATQSLQIRPLGNDEIKVFPIIKSTELQGRTPMEMVRAIADDYKKQEDIFHYDINEISSKDYIMTHIRPRLMKKQDNSNADTMGIITIPLMDLEIYFAVVLSEQHSDDGEEQISYSLDKSMIEDMDVTIDDLLEAAKNNFRPHITVESIEDVLGLGEGVDTFYVASDDKRHFGAPVMICDDILRNEFFKIGPFSILPSSVHEVLFVPDSLHIGSDDLHSMVEDVNSSVVRPEEVLSNSVYHYDGKLTQVC